MNNDIELKFNHHGLIPAVLQDYYTRQVLMVAYMNREALDKTLETGKATFWSRSRKELWTKGETSGNYQEVVAIDYDCDADTLLVQVLPKGPACHTGETSCFYRNLYTNEEKPLETWISSINWPIRYRTAGKTLWKAPTPTTSSGKALTKSVKKSVKNPLKPSSLPKTIQRKSSPTRLLTCFII